MNNKVFVITGSQGSGKTTSLIKLTKHLKDEGLSVGGIIAHGFWNNNERTGFELENIQTGEKIILCQTNPAKGWAKFRRFYFNPEGFDFGNKVLDPANLDKTEIIVIDEVGPLELEDKGWAQAIKSLLKTTGKPVIFVVRESLTKDIIKHFKIENSIIIDTGLSAGEVAKTIFG
jgi:nucleoside-triphosphatase THEP1